MKISIGRELGGRGRHCPRCFAEHRRLSRGEIGGRALQVRAQLVERI